MNDYERIAAVICYLDKNHAEQPSLAILAERAGLSSFHFHRLFSRWAGITPKDFLQCLTLAHSKALLAEGKDVLNVALYAGLSGPSRLHDLCVSLEAASSGEIKSGGAGWTIRAGFAESPFGKCLVGESPRGICHLAFVESVSRKAGAAAIQRHWPRASLQWDDSAASQLVGPLFQRPDNSTSRPTLRAFVRGTGFQFRVWRALLEVPKGTLVSYGELMLCFLSIAAKRGLLIDSYCDEAVGVMAKNAAGKLAMTQVTLRPAVVFGGERHPTQPEVEAMHHDSHEQCFIASSVKTDVRCEPELGPGYAHTSAALDTEQLMQNVDTLISLIRESRDHEALEMLAASPKLATEHSQQEGQLHGASPLHWAAHCNAVEICERLIQLGADVNDSATHWWRTPLAWAADAGRAEAVQLLLNRGAEVNKDAVVGTTALHAVAMGGSSRGSRDPDAYRRTTEILIAHGADVNRRATEDRGQTPLDDAIAQKNDHVAVVLRQHDAQVSISQTENDA